MPVSACLTIVKIGLSQCPVFDVEASFALLRENRNPDIRYAPGGCSLIRPVPIRDGPLYLVVSMNWDSKWALDWRLSNSLDMASYGQPEILYSVRGGHYTSEGLADLLKDYDAKISMDGLYPYRAPLAQFLI